LTSAQNAGTDCTKTLPDGHTEYWANNYSYDAWGNLLQKKPTKCSAENLSLTASATNQLQGGYSYDIAGNMIHDGTANLNYSYDQENRITGAVGFIYSYDADGNRVEKANGNTGTLYWYMSVGIVAESDLLGNLQSEYVFFDGERVARKDFPSNTVSYYFSDHLKTASVITDAAGSIKSESDYYPWGGELQFTNNDSNHYKFTGKERDNETGLDYFGARYYSNGLGRFITPDWSAIPTPVPYAELSKPQSLNQYTYVRNIPTTSFDVDGHDGAWEKFEIAVRLAWEVSKNPPLPRIELKGVNEVADAVSNGLNLLSNASSTLVNECTCQEPKSQDNNKQNNNSNQQNTSGKADQLKANAAKGKASEEKVLSEKGLAKNAEKVTGTEGKSIPDYQTKTTVGEIKDAKQISNTQQLRIQKQAAETSGRQHELVTGTNYNVTDNAAQGTNVIRRNDLGPKDPK
jgi:RHS repeat-associated protein